MARQDTAKQDMTMAREAPSFQTSAEYLEKALTMLETAIETKLESRNETGDYEEEVQRMNADRSRLAQALDESESRAERLEVANRDVSRRLITAMEMIRSVVEQ